MTNVYKNIVSIFLLVLLSCSCGGETPQNKKAPQKRTLSAYEKELLPYSSVAENEVPPKIQGTWYNPSRNCTKVVITKNEISFQLYDWKNKKDVNLTYPVNTQHTLAIDFPPDSAKQVFVQKQWKPPKFIS